MPLTLSRNRRIAAAGPLLASCTCRGSARALQGLACPPQTPCGHCIVLQVARRRQSCPPSPAVGAAVPAPERWIATLCVQAAAMGAGRKTFSYDFDTRWVNRGWVVLLCLLLCRVCASCLPE